MLCALAAPPRLRLRYCCSSASIVVGSPSMTIVPRLGRPSAPIGQDHPVAELRIQVPLEEIGRLHDVHVGVDEAEVVFHGSGLLFSQTLS